jgi:hypothetical protein
MSYFITYIDQENSGQLGDPAERSILWTLSQLVLTSVSILRRGLLMAAASGSLGDLAIPRWGYCEQTGRRHREADDRGGRKAWLEAKQGRKR